MKLTIALIMSLAISSFAVLPNVITSPVNKSTLHDTNITFTWTCKGNGYGTDDLYDTLSRIFIYTSEDTIIATVSGTHVISFDTIISLVYMCDSGGSFNYTHTLHFNKLKYPNQCIVCIERTSDDVAWFVQMSDTFYIDTPFTTPTSIKTRPKVSAVIQKGKVRSFLLNGREVNLDARMQKNLKVIQQ
jgi:hypothetical protein